MSCQVRVLLGYGGKLMTELPCLEVGLNPNIPNESIFLYSSKVVGRLQDGIHSTHAYETTSHLHYHIWYGFVHSDPLRTCPDSVT